MTTDIKLAKETREHYNRIIDLLLELKSRGYEIHIIST